MGRAERLVGRIAIHSNGGELITQTEQSVGMPVSAVWHSDSGE